MGLLDWLSLGLDFCPVIGEAKAILELISGKDLITQEELNAFDRATCAISIIPAAGWLAKMSKTSKAAKHAKKFEKFFTLVNKANKANDAVDKFNLIRQILEESDVEVKSIKLDPKILERMKSLSLQKNNKNSGAEMAKVIKTLPKNNKKSVSEIATEVIRGNWGNGEERKRRLEAAGYNYKEVQNEVNRRLKK